MSKAIFDEIGYWSEIKLAIIREYAQAYSVIINATKKPDLYHIYVDAFAGAGISLSKATGDFVPGSPLNALLVQPPFREYHFIDLDGDKIEQLKLITHEYENAEVYRGNCNEILIDIIFPKAKWTDFKRALCLLDPYGLHLDWKVVETAGKMRSIEIFLNFPVMDMNMNVLWHNPEKVSPKQIERMNAFWGDESWRKAAYDTSGNLFGFEEKLGNRAIVEAYQERLKKAAGFRYVPDPIPMRNSTGATVYYLFFASQKPVARKIVSDIFGKYRNRGAG